MSIFILGISLLYLILMLYFLLGWQKISAKKTTVSYTKSFSIVIPYRNEAANLEELFHSLYQLNYPLDNFEIILVNDHSEDNSVEVCQQFQKQNPNLSIKILQNKETSKKQALSTGILQAKFDYIVSTDADCIVPEDWLSIFNSHLTPQTALLAGPVIFNDTSEIPFWLKALQELDFLSLQAVGGGAFGWQQPFLCNGANLCFKKKDFLKVGGYEGNENISSGDDVFLLQKFQKGKLECQFIKDKSLIVRTNYQQDPKNLFRQRWRWAAKSSAYTSFLAIFSGLLVLLENFGLLAAIVLSILQVISWKTSVLAFLIKFNADFILINSSAKFFGKEKFLNSFWWCSIFYPFFATAVAVSSLFGKFTWKGRTYKK